MKKSMLKKTILMSLVCGNILACSQAWASTVDVKAGARLGTTVNNNTVIGRHLNGSVDNMFAYAYNGTTAAESTTWTLSGTDIWGNVLGSYVNGISDADSNIVSIFGGTFDTSACIYGGQSLGGTAGKNEVNINGISTGDITAIYGGHGGSGASGNTVNINATGMGTVTGDTDGISVVGGYAGNSGNVDNNVVIISSGKYSNNIYGGYSKNGVAGSMEGMGNTVSIVGATSKVDEVYGGFGKTGASYNMVTISAVGIGTVTGEIYGGYVSGTGNADSNMVNISSGTYDDMIYGGYTEDGKAGSDSGKGNVVNISGGTMFPGVVGGQGSAGANYNQINIYGTCSGMFDTVFGGSSSGGTANYNVITISGGDLGGAVYGGCTNSGNATYNTVILNGGTIENNVKIYGGYSGGAGSVTGNTVVLGSNVNWNGTGIEIYGGSDGTTITDNTMRILRNNLSSTGSHSFALADNFDTYIFDLTNVQADDVLLSNTTAISITEIANITIENAERSQLKKDDSIVLMDLTSGGTDLTGKIQPSSDYSITIDGTNKMILTALKDLGGGENVYKAPVEGIAAATATVNSSSDLACGAGMSNLLTSTANITNTETFGAANFGNAKYKSGSHVDARGYGIMVGVGKKVFNKAGDKTTGGIFFEYGNSNFDTYNGNVTGEGKSIYKGGGYIMRFDNTCGNYYEGMIHAGKVRTNWSQDGTGNNYDINPTYFGGALTYGHKFMVAKERQLAVYGSYIYTHTGDADAIIGTNDYHFESSNSHRTKLGVRYSASDLMDTRKFRPYVGLAWEHEYDGESRATIKGMGEAPAPSMKGHSGILEIGCNQEVGKWTLGIGTELFTGKRKGWSGTVQATYNF